MRGFLGLAIHRAHLSGHTATATAHIRVKFNAHARIKPLSVPNGFASCEREPLHDGSIARYKHDRP